MGRRRKPQLNHKSVECAKVSDWLHRELVARKENILNLVGFHREFGDPKDPTYTGRTAESELISEITGLLATALTIRLDAGYKAPRKVVAIRRYEPRTHDATRHSLRNRRTFGFQSGVQRIFR